MVECPTSRNHCGGLGEVRVLQGRDLMTTVVPHTRAGTLTEHPEPGGEESVKEY